MNEAQKVRLRVFLRDLPILEQGVLRARFGLDGKGTKTRDEVARAFDLTVGQVEELEARALVRLRRVLL